MRRLKILVMISAVLIFSFSVAEAGWEAQDPSTALVLPYINATSGFQTFVLVSHQDTYPDEGQSPNNPNVVVKFNPKCGRGGSQSFSLTTRQSFVVTPPNLIEGWAEVFAKGDISDGYVDAYYPLSALAVILDIGNGVAYSVKSVNLEHEFICVDGAGDPLFYNCNCDGSNCGGSSWGDGDDSQIVADLWRHSDYGRTMFVLCDPNGRHIDPPIPNPAPASGWLPEDLYLPNKAQLDIYSKSETDAHLSVEWCTGDDAGKPGIVTIGVGTTDGPLGTTDTMIANPAAAMTDAAYGFGQAYNLREWGWCGDGLIQPGEECDIDVLFGAVLTRISNTTFPLAVDAHMMIDKNE